MTSRLIIPTQRPPISRTPRPSVTRELPVHVDLHAVDLDVPAAAQVADHVPVQARAVLVPRLGIALAQREMDGAADLFVEEGVFRVARDAVVRADRALA